MIKVNVLKIPTRLQVLSGFVSKVWDAISWLFGNKKHDDDIDLFSATQHALRVRDRLETVIMSSGAIDSYAEWGRTVEQIEQFLREMQGVLIFDYWTEYGIGSHGYQADITIFLNGNHEWTWTYCVGNGKWYRSRMGG